jgi:hypothetical protein
LLNLLLLLFKGAKYEGVEEKFLFPATQGGKIKFIFTCTPEGIKAF